MADALLCQVCEGPCDDELPPPSQRAYRCCRGCGSLAMDAPEPLSPPLYVARALYSLKRALETASFENVSTEAEARDAVVRAHRARQWYWAKPVPADVRMLNKPPGVRLASYPLRDRSARGVRPDASLEIWMGGTRPRAHLAIEVKFPPLGGFKTPSEIQRGWGQCLLYCDGATAKGEHYDGGALVIIERSRERTAGWMGARSYSMTTPDGSPRWLWYLHIVVSPAAQDWPR